MNTDHKVQHSKIPFYLQDTNPLDIYIREGKKGKVICEMPDSGLTEEQEESKANAAFIVKACNNHYALLEALETCYNWAKNGEQENLIVFEMAVEVIKKAKGGENV